VLKSSGASSPGFSTTPEELDARVRAYLDSPTNADQVNAGWSAISRVTGTMRQSDSLRWVAPLDLKSAVEKAYTERFGTKEEATKKAKAQAEQAKKVSPSLGLFEGQMDRLLSACILTISLRCL
jgi:glutaminyl-tRNA synthetase